MWFYSISPAENKSPPTGNDRSVLVALFRTMCFGSTSDGSPSGHIDLTRPDMAWDVFEKRKRKINYRDRPFCEIQKLSKKGTRG